MSATQIKLERETMFKWKKKCEELQQELADTKKKLDYSEKQFSTMKDALDIKSGQIKKLEAFKKEALEVIGFYGDYSSYGTTKNVRPRIPWEKRLITTNDVDESLIGIFPCGGKRARAFLQKHTTKMEG